MSVRHEERSSDEVRTSVGCRRPPRGNAGFGSRVAVVASQETVRSYGSAKGPRSFRRGSRSCRFVHATFVDETEVHDGLGAKATGRAVSLRFGIKSSDERLPAGASRRVAGTKVREDGVSPGKLMTRPRTASSPWQVRKRYEDCSGCGVSQTPGSNGRRAKHDDPSCGQGRVQREHALPGAALSPGRTGRSTRSQNGVRSKSCLGFAGWNISAIVGPREGPARDRRKRGQRREGRAERDSTVDRLGARSQNHLDAWLRDFAKRDATSQAREVVVDAS